MDLGRLSPTRLVLTRLCQATQYLHAKKTGLVPGPMHPVRRLILSLEDVGSTLKSVEQAEELMEKFEPVVHPTTPFTWRTRHDSP